MLTLPLYHSHTCVGKQWRTAPICRLLGAFAGPLLQFTLCRPETFKRVFWQTVKTHWWNVEFCQILYHLLNPFTPNRFRTFITCMSPYPILGLLGGIFHFYSNFDRTFCKQTVENLIRCHFLWCLNWFCTICRCPTKRTLDGLNKIKLHRKKYNIFWKL